MEFNKNKSCIEISRKIVIKEIIHSLIKTRVVLKFIKEQRKIVFYNVKTRVVLKLQ